MATFTFWLRPNSTPIDGKHTFETPSWKCVAENFQEAEQKLTEAGLREQAFCWVKELPKEEE